MLLLERPVNSYDDQSDILILTKETIRRVVDIGSGTVIILFANGKAYEVHSDNVYPILKADDIVAKLFRNDKDGHPYVINCNKIERQIASSFDW